MILAEHSQYKHIMKLMRNSGWLAHIRSDYIKRMIREKNVVYDSGVILITRHYRRKQSLGYKTFSLIGDWRICQIFSSMARVSPATTGSYRGTFDGQCYCFRPGYSSPRVCRGIVFARGWGTPAGAARGIELCGRSYDIL